MAKKNHARTKKRAAVITKRAGSPRKPVNGKSATGGKTTKRAIAQYDHRDKKRINIPPVGLVNPETDPIEALMPSPPARTYEYDPHLDPQLQWAGKKERLSFNVPTVSLHVHERIDPKTIIEAVRVKNGLTSGVAMSHSRQGKCWTSCSGIVHRLYGYSPRQLYHSFGI